MIQINDKVLYGVHGVCNVEAVEEKKIAGKIMEYYVLKPLYDHGSTVYVPKANEALVSKIKRIMSADEIFDTIRSIPDEELIVFENESDRHQIFNEILCSGDRVQLIRLIKTLYVRQQKRIEQKKNLLMSDEKCMKDAERILYEEFAYVLKIERDQVLPFITRQIEVDRKI